MSGNEKLCTSLRLRTAIDISATIESRFRIFDSVKQIFSLNPFNFRSVCDFSVFFLFCSVKEESRRDYAIFWSLIYFLFFVSENAKFFLTFRQFAHSSSVRNAWNELMHGWIGRSSNMKILGRIMKLLFYTFSGIYSGHWDFVLPSFFKVLVHCNGNGNWLLNASHFHHISGPGALLISPDLSAVRQSVCGKIGE